MSKRAKRARAAKGRRKADDALAARAGDGDGQQVVAPAVPALLRHANDHPGRPGLRPAVADQLRALQASHGNQYVQRLVARQADAATAGLLDADQERAAVRYTRNRGYDAKAIKVIQSLAGVGKDGIYGRRSAEGVAAYQRRVGITVDGMVGPQTLGKMIARLRSVGRSADAAHLAAESGAEAEPQGGAPAGGPISIAHTVSLIPQPTAVTCWAAALAMVVGWRDKESIPPSTVASRAGMNTTTGYGWGAIRRAVATWGLRERGPQSAMPSLWARLLRSLGPLWIVEVGAPYHAVVLGGMHGDGTTDATEVTLYNPWPPGSGAIEHKTFMDFDSDFGLGAGANAAVVHA